MRDRLDFAAERMQRMQGPGPGGGQELRRPEKGILAQPDAPSHGLAPRPKLPPAPVQPEGMVGGGRWPGTAIMAILLALSVPWGRVG